MVIGMKSIGNILGSNNAQSPVIRRATAALVVETANSVLADIFGDGVSAFAEVIFVKDRVLSVKCKGAPAAQEIKLNENDILAKISDKLGFKAVSKIRYIV